MIFLAEFTTDGPRYRNEMVPSEKNKNKASMKNKKKVSMKNKKKPTKQKNSTFTKLVNKTAGVASFTEGEIAVVKSIAANNVKTPLNNLKGKQKTISAKKNTKYHKSI